MFVIETPYIKFNFVNSNRNSCNNSDSNRNSNRVAFSHNNSEWNKTIKSSCNPNNIFNLKKYI